MSNVRNIQAGGYALLLLMIFLSGGMVLLADEFPSVISVHRWIVYFKNMVTKLKKSTNIWNFVLQITIFLFY